MATVIELINLGLVQLGDSGGLAALTDDADSAQRANQVYPIARDALLASHPWNFAMARAQVAADVDDDGNAIKPAFGWDLQYTLPAGCLRAYRLNDMPIAREVWEVERGKILTDITSPINLRYIQRVEDTEMWSPAFTDAMAADLAMRLARSETATANLVEAASRNAAARLAEARWIDSQEKGALEETPGPLMQAHWDAS